MPVKIACCTGGFRNLTLEETLTILEEIGFKYVECTTDGKAHIYPYLFEGRNLSELEGILRQSKVALVAVSGGWSDFAVANHQLDAQYESLQRQFELCKHFGVKLLRVFASHLPPQYIDDAMVSRVIRNIKRIVPEARDKGVCMAMENHYGITATADDMLRILDGVSSEWLQANFDPANFVPIGEDPVHACKKLLPYIAHVHLKDVRFTGKGRHNGYEYCEIGAGTVDYSSILSILGEAHYSGFLSVEYETFEDVVRGTVIAHRNLKKLLSKVPGSAV
ncbi:MAG: sugar phosphate isomerase/epimerase [Chloroflexi bacterium]|nr:sugar phosphate isomerase/epimerase [Chloroflexota bacterium]